MDKETFLKKMQTAVENPRLTALFVDLQLSVGHTDRHYYEAFCGFQHLKEYISTSNEELLEKAIRQFDYVQEEDLKYVRAICYYGKAIAYAYYQTGKGFSASYAWIRHLTSIWVTIATDRSEFIEELQTEARHLKQDIYAWDKVQNPFMSMFRG